MKELKQARQIIDDWISANKEMIGYCIDGGNYSGAATLDSYNNGMEQAIILVEQAFHETTMTEAEQIEEVREGRT